MAWRETLQRAYPSARTVSAVRSTGFARRIAGGRPEESRVLAKPRSAADVQQRSEERRVGKECRYRWAPEQKKKGCCRRSRACRECPAAGGFRGPPNSAGRRWPLTFRRARQGQAKT